LKANNEVDRENWLQALEHARHYAIKRSDSDEEDSIVIENGNELNKMMGDVKTTLNKKLDELRSVEAKISEFLQIIERFYLCFLEKLSGELSKSLKLEDKSLSEKIKTMKGNVEQLVQVT
jgi:hypothetical protein